jgi:hypothetical protein
MLFKNPFRKIKFEEGTWNLPYISISDDNISYFYHHTKQITLGCRKDAPEDYCVAVLCHELNHWAHDYFLSSEDLYKIRNYVNSSTASTYQDLLTESVAWWGTNYRHSWRSWDSGRIEIEER